MHYLHWSQQWTVVTGGPVTLRTFDTAPSAEAIASVWVYDSSTYPYRG